MIPARFDYHQPRSVGEAVALLQRYGTEAKVLAGGHSLLPMMKLRFAQPQHLVDINRIDALRGIRLEADTVVIGAMTVENDLIDSAVLQREVPLLAEAPKLIADPQVRNRGTIGGDLAHGDPGNDHPALALVCDAHFVLEGPAGRRSVAAGEFFLGILTTQLAEDEILVEIRIPRFAPGTGWAYEKLKRKTGDWATAGCAVVMRREGNRIGHLRIGLTNLAPVALRAEKAETLLLGGDLGSARLESAVEAVMAVCDPAEDLRGDAEYKTAMAGEMLRRALHHAWARCA
ncbi:MAG: xanthine dehydrogenase family protein subunit M [Betaproteobacteria bacterium]|nr:xanthine dehydrogenase family protein subunit M [Betaproteobacteria bacterium]